MLHYIIQTVAFQLFFLIIYDVFLKKETFFNWNRAYLLTTAILSLALPFIKINRLKEIVPEEFVIRLPEVIIGNLSPSQNDTTILIQQIQQQSNFEWSWELLLFGGMLIATVVLVFKIGKLLWMIYSNPKRWKGNLLIIKLLKSNAAFSFFHYIFLGERINFEERETIINHELIHVKHKHTLDLLFFEILRIVFWFNPLIYLYQNRITALHEYIADAKTIKEQGKKEYYQNLLSQVFETQNISFVNTFFKQSLIKKRIVMLSKSKSKRNHILKYALLIPMVFCMLLYTSSYTQEKTSKTDDVNQELNDNQLENKLYKKLILMNENEVDFFEIAEKHMPNSNKYILSRDDFFKFKVYIKFIGEQFVESKREEGTLTGKDTKMFEKISNKHKTYAEYLEWKKTDKAKRSWESNIKDDVLRLVVDDLANFTDEEQRRYDKKMKMIIEDDYFNKLLLTDGKKMMTMGFHSSEQKVESIEESVEIPFSIIDETPTFTFCQALPTNEERKQCMSDNISKHVNRNFNLDIAKTLGLEGRQRINVIFKIDTIGNVINIRARASHPDLAEEAKRVIGTLPQFIPGKQKGKAVVVPYSLPIVFQVNADKTQSLRNALEDSINAVNEKSNNDEENTKSLEEIYEASYIKGYYEGYIGDSVPFSVVDEVPTFISCDRLKTNAERKKCTADNISKYVGESFNIDVAISTGLEGRQRINVVFKIDTDGNVVNIKVKAPHSVLEAETKRVIKTLPQFIPGKHRGKAVIVSYKLPILFNVKE